MKKKSKRARKNTIAAIERKKKKAIIRKKNRMRMKRAATLAGLKQQSLNEVPEEKKLECTPEPQEVVTDEINRKKPKYGSHEYKSRIETSEDLTIDYEFQQTIKSQEADHVSQKNELKQETGQIFSGKKIAYILHADQLSHIENHIASLCRGLKDEFEIHVVVLIQDECHPQDVCQLLVNAGAKVHPILIKKTFTIKTAKIIREILSQESVDIIHTHYKIADTFGFFLKKLNKDLQWITTIHGYYPFKQMSRSILYAYKKMLKRSRWAIYTSKYTQQSVESILPIKDSSVIYHGIEDTLVPRPSSFVPRQNILFVGALTEQNSCEDLIKAFSLIKFLKSSLRLQIIGEGPEKQKLVMLTKTMEILDKVEFLSPREDLSQYYSEAAIYVLPSYTEGLSPSLIQAMKHARPIVAVGGTNVSECLTDQETALLVQPRNTYQMSMAMKKILEDDNLRQNLGKNARRVFEEKFTLNQMLEKYRVLYRMI